MTNTGDTKMSDTEISNLSFEEIKQQFPSLFGEERKFTRRERTHHQKDSEAVRIKKQNIRLTRRRLRNIEGCEKIIEELDNEELNIEEPEEECCDDDEPASTIQSKPYILREYGPDEYEEFIVDLIEHLTGIDVSDKLVFGGIRTAVDEDNPTVYGVRMHIRDVHVEPDVKAYFRLKDELGNIADFKLYDGSYGNRIVFYNSDDPPNPGIIEDGIYLK